MTLLVWLGGIFGSGKFVDAAVAGRSFESDRLKTVGWRMLSEGLRVWPKPNLEEPPRVSGA